MVGRHTVEALRQRVPSAPTRSGAAAGARTPRRNVTGDDVAFVQRFIGVKRCGPASGRFDAATEAGVRCYQGMRGLATDGVVGRTTWAAMGVHASY